jgi:hypothetical protein
VLVLLLTQKTGSDDSDSDSDGSGSEREAIQAALGVHTASTSFSLLSVMILDVWLPQLSVVRVTISRQVLAREPKLNLL